ncbi:MAG: Fic family protein [Flavobacteriales bacterium]|nr:Fic family protein [Flavobacteriales bacterium]
MAIRNQPLQPYNELPDPPGAERLETPAVLRRTIAARATLAELKGACQQLPEPALLLNTVMLQESQDSSAIENIVTTRDQLYQAILNPLDAAPPSVKEVLRYREAMHEGIAAMQRAGGISVNTAVQVMQRIKHTGVGIRTLPGTQLGNPASGQVIYTPPAPTMLPGLMARWERFTNEAEGMDPLVRMAAMHYWFEAIHPFADGNGRTGRILNVLFLIHAGLLLHPVLYLSSHILRHKPAYYRCLRRVTEEDAWEDWLLFMLGAVEETARATLGLVTGIARLKQEFAAEARALDNKLPATDLAGLLFSFPYVKVGTLMDHQLGSRPTVTAYLRTLVKHGMLNEVRRGRENYFINHRLITLIQNSGSPSE